MTEMPSKNTNEDSQNENTRKVVPVVKIEKIVPGIKPIKENQLDQGLHDFSYFSDEAIKNLFYLFEWKNTIQVFSEFAKPFKNQVIVDIGAGRNGVGYFIAGFTEAKAYIGVEPSDYNFATLEHLFAQDGKVSGNERFLRDVGFLTDIFRKPLPPASLVHQDGLSFLRRLPDQSISILASGIDDAIIQNLQYRKETETEIERVLHPKGAYISWASIFRLNPTEFEAINLTEKEQEIVKLQFPKDLTKYVRKSKSS